MDLFNILHHGAVDGVTGSCHELRLGDDYGVLVDCGLFQGAETSGEGAGAERLEIGFPLAHIKALVVTHVHIDHVGRIPYLLAAGFRGPILCSQPSAHLLPLVLEDAVKLGFSRDPQLVEAFMGQLKQQVLGLPYDHWFTLLDETFVGERARIVVSNDREAPEPPTGPAPATRGRQLRVRLQPAGHILGSAYVEFDCAGKNVPARRVIFSGDLGAPHSPLLPEPKSPERCDTLVIESTYGDRCHPDRTQRRAQLQAVLQRALANSGVVLIPAFSIGRTQELLYELETLVAETLPGLSANRPSAARGTAVPRDKNATPLAGLPVIVDSPLASRFTQSYRTLKPFWDAEALEVLQQGRDPLDFDQLITVGSHQDHERMLRRLRETHEPCVVIAASGMCAGGRIVNYLKALLDDPRTDLVFVGYQARGTPGRAILEQRDKAEPSVLLDGERISIRARVHQLSGYSAHADRADLLAFVRGIPEPPSEIRIVHGEDAAKQSLAQALRISLPHAHVSVP